MKSRDPVFLSCMIGRPRSWLVYCSHYGRTEYTGRQQDGKIEECSIRPRADDGHSFIGIFSAQLAVGGKHGGG